MAEEKKKKKKDNDPFMKTVIRRRNVLKPESESDYSSVLRDALHNENTSGYLTMSVIILGGFHASFHPTPDGIH